MKRIIVFGVMIDLRLKMPDITMCQGKGCQQRYCCYRFTALPDKFHQSWFSKEPNTTKNKCDYLMDKKN